MKRNSVRNKVIETASRLFYDQGYNSTGINQIWEEAGVSKAAMYQNFRSKEDICIAFLKYMDAGLQKDLADFFLEKPIGSKRILELFEFLKLLFEKDNFRGCWCLNTISELPRDDKKVMCEIRRQKDDFRAYIASLLDDGISERGKMADMVFILWEGAITESQVYMKPWPIKRAKEMAKKLLI